MSVLIVIINQKQDANVSARLYGANGDSGRWALDAPGNTFERKSTGVFGVKCIDLGKLTKLQLSHDGAGFGSAWFVDKVIVEDMVINEYYFIF